MALSWNEIRSRALTFSKRWENETSEDAEAKAFWIEFLNVFGIDRKRVASFEEPVKKLGDKQGFIDLFWKGMLLVEHKSRGKNLNKAYTQALDYFPGIKERDLPKYVLVSDFARFRLYDLEAEHTSSEGDFYEFELKDLHKNIKHFAFIAGYQTRAIKPEDPVNIKAAELMGKLHDALKAIGYEGHALEHYLVRLLFCLFAEDTGIFERQQLKEYIQDKTTEDGSDLAAHLAQLFEVLNTPKDKRLKNLDEHLAAFEYVNGKLFAEHLPTASFDAKMRNQLLDCCALDWSRVSPAIFGSLFQSVMNDVLRRNLGAHYTSETNILKLIKPLFLDELHNEFDSCKSNTKKLTEFHDKLRKLKFFDPACGCGNFLVIAYRELRLLELEVLRSILAAQRGQGFVDVSGLVWLDVDQFYGIEIEEFPAQIAQVAMWLTDHQMNQLISEEFGNYFARLPLKKSATIICGNSLQLDWKEVAPNVDYILGNPPFVGKKEQSASQKTDMEQIFKGVKGAGVLDFVSAWYLKAAQYMQSEKVLSAFVSTNSITQGEQVGILWGELLNKYHIKIHFAHRTFKWGNDARGNAAVHCVIIGFSPFDVSEKRIWDYEKPDSDAHELKVRNINPYLVDAADVVVEKRMNPLCQGAEIVFGSKAVDFGHFVIEADELENFLVAEPLAAPYVREFIGGEEFLNGSKRYCLWLKELAPERLRNMPLVLKRVEAVKEERLKSVKEPTRELAKTPSLFGEDRQPNSQYLLIPKVSSERRDYVPLGFMSPEVIINPTVLVVPNASIYDFGVLQSNMHMAWMRAVCGRMKSDYQYSASIVYNNFPWPVALSDKQREAVESAAQTVLDARAQFPQSSLADLYDPLTMPPALVKAHQALDRAVDACYRKAAFTNDAQRVEFLFERYQQLTSLLPREKKVSKRIMRT